MAGAGFARGGFGPGGKACGLVTITARPRGGGWPIRPPPGHAGRPPPLGEIGQEIGPVSQPLRPSFRRWDGERNAAWRPQRSPHGVPARRRPGRQPSKNRIRQADLPNFPPIVASATDSSSDRGRHERGAVRGRASRAARPFGAVFEATRPRFPAFPQKMDEG